MSRRHRSLDARRWALVRRLVFDRDGWRCRACNRAGRLEVHHRVALEDGGEPYALGNLCALCRPCHFAATAAAQAEKLPAEVRAWREWIYTRSVTEVDRLRDVTQR